MRFPSFPLSAVGQFIYDPATDRGDLLNTPAQPPLQVMGFQQQGTPVQPGMHPEMNPVASASEISRCTVSP